MARIIDGSAMNLVGKKIKKLRKQRKMTQRELSEKLELLGVYVCRGRRFADFHVRRNLLFARSACRSRPLSGKARSGVYLPQKAALPLFEE